MFDRFTDRARQVVQTAQDEARGLKHAEIGTGHIAVALTLNGGVAGQVLEDIGVTTDALRERIVPVRAQLARPRPLRDGLMPLDAGAKAVIERSLHETLRLGTDTIGTEHLLLALIHIRPEQDLDEIDPFARLISDLSGLTFNEIHDRTTEILARVTAEGVDSHRQAASDADADADAAADAAADGVGRPEPRSMHRERDEVGPTGPPDDASFAVTPETIVQLTDGKIHSVSALHALGAVVTLDTETRHYPWHQVTVIARPNP